MIIEKGKWYLKLEEEKGKQLIIDCIQYNPSGLDYTLYESETVPNDLLNQCSYLEDGVIVRDEKKYKLWLEQNK